jgi:hypothetical protein
MAGQLFQKCKLEILRSDAAAVLTAAEALEAISREHGLAPFACGPNICGLGVGPFP